MSSAAPQVYILHNGTSIANSGGLPEDPPWPATLNSVTLAAGDTVDAVIGVGADNNYAGATANFSFTVTAVDTSLDKFVPGALTGLIAGSSGVEGILTGHVQRSGDFTAQLDLEGLTVPLTGRFNRPESIPRPSP